VITMPHPCPHHCPRPSGGGGAAIVVLVVLVLVAVLAKPAAHAADDAVHMVITAAEVAAMVLGGVAVLTVVAVGARVAVRARASHAITGRVVQVHQIALPAQPLPAPQPAAIEAPRPSLADIKSLAAEHGYDVVRRED
jgi:hypothetical protein